MSDRGEVVRAFGLVLVLGSQFAVISGAFIYFGAALDEKFDLSPWLTASGGITGLVASVFVIMRSLRRAKL